MNWRRLSNFTFSYMARETCYNTYDKRYSRTVGSNLGVPDFGDSWVLSTISTRKRRLFCKRLSGLRALLQMCSWVNPLFLMSTWISLRLSLSVNRFKWFNSSLLKEMRSSLISLLVVLTVITSMVESLFWLTMDMRIRIAIHPLASVALPLSRFLELLLILLDSLIENLSKLRSVS